MIDINKNIHKIDHVYELGIKHFILCVENQENYRRATPGLINSNVFSTVGNLW